MDLCSAIFKTVSQSLSLNLSNLLAFQAVRKMTTAKGINAFAVFSFFGIACALPISAKGSGSDFSLGLGSGLGTVTLSEALRRNLELTPAPWDGKFSETVTSKGGCVISEIYLNVKDEQTGERWPIHTTLYRPKVTTPVPMSLVVPTIEGITVLEPRVASMLCASKIAGMIAMLHDTTQPAVLPSWGYEDRVDRREILGLRTLLDFASQDARFDKQKLGIFGMSYGGIITAFMAGLEPERLRAIVIAVGGGNLPHILSMSDNDKVGLLRQRRMTALGIDDLGNYEATLAPTVRYDPLFFTSQANRARIMMVMSTVDTKVIASTQRELFDAFGGTQDMLFNWGHVETLVQLAYLYMDPMVKFMQSRFDGKDISSGLVTVN